MDMTSNISAVLTISLELITMSSHSVLSPKTSSDFLSPDDVTSSSLFQLSVSPPFDPIYFDYAIYMPDLDSSRHQWIDDWAFLPTTIVYSLAFVIGALGNAVVACALLGDSRARSPTSSFLASLALADIIFVVVCVPYEVLVKMSSIWNGGNFLCKLTGFVEMLSGVSSVLNLTAVSIERYAVIVHPIKSRLWCSLGRTHRIILIVWTLAIVICSPCLYIMIKTQGLLYNNDNYVIVMTCADHNVIGSTDRIVFAWYQLIIMFVLPVAVIVYCYIFVIQVLWQSTKDLDRLTHAGRSREEDCRQRLTQSRNRKRSKPSDVSHFDVRQARIQVIKMLLTIIVFFFFCWGPKWVLNIMKRHELSILHKDSAFYVMLIIHLMPYIQSGVNPIIYSFMSNNFRSSLRNQCRRLRQCVCVRRRPRGSVPTYRRDLTFDMESIDKWSTAGARQKNSTRAATYTSVVSEVSISLEKS